MNKNNIEINLQKNEEILPFLNWAGGKRWLAKNHLSSSIFPKYKRYIEPFAGSAAMFFAEKPELAVLNDVNTNLTKTYTAIKNNWFKVYKYLEEHHYSHGPEYYYFIREFDTANIYEEAAKFIYLNRTCFNGLYRVNQDGQFNVPIGTKTKAILDTDNFLLVSKLLKNVEILNKDFQMIVDSTSAGDFIFVDPPYTVKSNNSPYVKYNQDYFSWDDQVRLKDSLEMASSRGVKFLQTNICDESIRKLYRGTGFSVTPIDRSSSFSSHGSKRGIYTEYIIKNY